MAKRIIQATTKENKVHTFVYNKKSLAILDQLQEHYTSIVLLETKNNVIFKVVKKLFKNN